MGKTVDPSKAADPAANDEIVIVHPDPSQAEELSRRYAPLRQFLREQLERSRRMTPEEQRKADEDWENLKRTLNEGRVRPVIVDD